MPTEADGIIMRIIVTGAAGFIGFHLSRRLLGAGHEVIGIDSMTTGSPANAADLRRLPNFSFLKQDIVNLPAIDGQVSRIYNMACPASPVDFRDKALEIMATCSTGVRNLLELARQKNALFLQASTSECYGDPLEHPQPETYFGNVNPIGPRAPYDEGKRFAEALTMSYHRLHGVPTRIVRIFNTYGPRMRADDGRMLPTFIMQALAGRPLSVHGDGSQTRSFCYVDDLVEAILRVADSDFSEPINIGNDAEITIRQAAEAVIELTGSSSKIEYVARPVNDPERRRPDLTRARSVLGWSPVMPWRDGFARTIQSFKSTGS
ncbi:MAG TPA: UDP-glucuronic acid decarboxylase family protein [Phycisphaerae bacterium]|nr:UDP-glucuronic acid decarboxylase family protein [Phycisphaerae bacterium]